MTEKLSRLLLFAGKIKLMQRQKRQAVDRSAPFMDGIVVSKDRVSKLLKGLSLSKALGPDEVHPRVLKELAHPGLAS